MVVTNPVLAGDDPTTLNTDESTTIGTVNSDYMDAKMALETATKALDNNQRPTQVPALEEVKNQAQARYDFFAAQKARVEKALAAGDLVVDRLIGDDPSSVNTVETDFVIQDTPYTVEDYEALTDLQDAADDAADALKAAYDDRVAATDDLETNQRDTGAYLDQLVALRQNQKAAADAAAPEDAEEPTAAQKAADEKLANANAQLASFNELQALDDANPVKALVNALVEAEGTAEDDDGQALVDAIDATYQAANDAQTTADEVKALLTPDDPMTDEDESGAITANTNRSTANEAGIAGLTAEDDPLTEDEDESGAVTANTARSTANETAIDGLDDAILGEDGLDGRVAVNEAAIDDHTTKLEAKKAYIDNIAEELNLDAVTGDGTGEGGLTRLDDIETSVAEGDAATLAAAGEVADAGDAATLAAAGEAADAGDAATLAAAGEAADAGDAATLAAAGEAADAGDAATLAAAGEAADAGDAATLAAAGEAADAGDAAEAAMRYEADVMLAGAIMDEATARADADTAEATARADADTAEATTRYEADMMLAGAIMDEATDRTAADTMLAGGISDNTDAIAAEMTARDMADVALGGRIDMEAVDRMAADAANAEAIMMNAGNIAMNHSGMNSNAANISTNADGIAANMNAIGANSASIADNRNMIGELSDDLGVVRAGVAASMALAGMPAVNGRGISIGVGSFDGESAFAVGFQIQGEMASFKVGLTSGGGATGASAGVGFQF